MLSRNSPGFRIVVAGEAMDDGVKYFLFQRSRDLRASRNLHAGFRKTASFSEQTRKTVRIGVRRAKYPGRVR